MSGSVRSADRELADGLARLVDVVALHAAVVAASRGLAATDVRALGMIDRAGALRPGGLGRALRISPSGTSGVIKRLLAVAHRDAGPANHRDGRIRIAGSRLKELGLAPGRQADRAGLHRVT